MISKHCDDTGFKRFDHEPFEVKLEEPYVEEILTIGSDVQTSGYVPWWYSNGKITEIEDWSL